MTRAAGIERRTSVVLVVLVVLLASPRPHTHPFVGDRIRADLHTSTASPADNTPPEGFVALFNGKDLTGWKGLLAAPLDSRQRRVR